MQSLSSTTSVSGAEGVGDDDVDEESPEGLDLGLGEKKESCCCRLWTVLPFLLT